MDFYKNLQAICKAKNTTLTTVLKGCGLSKSYVTHWNPDKTGNPDRPTTKPTFEQMFLIAEYLNIPLDDIAGRESKTVSFEHQQLISSYERLSPANKKMAVGVINAIYDVQIEQEMPPFIRIYRSLNKVSAGKGYDLNDGDMWEEIKISDTPEACKTDFCVTVEGDSMLPDFSDGDTVLIKQCDAVELGEVGIFVKNGEGFIKEYGGDRLISLNKEYDDITFSDDDNVKCCGKVIGKAIRV